MPDKQSAGDRLSSQVTALIAGLTLVGIVGLAGIALKGLEEQGTARAERSALEKRIARNEQDIRAMMLKGQGPGR